MRYKLRSFPNRPGYSESLELLEYADTFSVVWYLYDEYYPGFEDHEYVVEGIPCGLLRDAVGESSNRGVANYLKRFFRANISAERFIRFLDAYGIPYTIVPDADWVPGVDDGEAFPRPTSHV